MPIYKMDGKKDGKQKYRVVICFQDALGKNKQITRVTWGFEEAKALETKLSYDIKEETPARSITMQELFNEYLNYIRHDVKESTLEYNKDRLERYVIPKLGGVSLKKIDVHKLQAFKDEISELDLALRTKQTIYSCLHAMLNYAVKMDYIPRNPLEKIGNFKNKEYTKKEMDYYTPEDFTKFIQVAKDFAEREEKNGSLFEWNYYVFFAIAFYTGLRKGELHALNWSDIKDGYLSVAKSINQKLKGDDRITPPKNKSSVRTLQLPKTLIEILDEHYERCKTYDGFSDECYICGLTKPLRDTTIQKRNDKYSKAASVKTIRIHDFRHSHASLLANEGINIQEIARRLGHSKIEITWQTYSHMYPREEERAVNILDSFKISK